MKLPKNITRVIAPGLLIISLSYIYLKTMAPDLTWANSGSDGGDLITAAATGGIAHPSGYPLYLLLARLFQLLPVGSLAYRTNLMSVFFAILTAYLVYVIVLKYLLAELDEPIATIAGLSAGYAIGLSPLFWSQALITEVYTLHAFFIVLIVFLATFPRMAVSQQIQFDRWKGIIYGLATGNHLTTIFLIPGALIVNSVEWNSSKQGFLYSIKNSRVIWKSVFRQIGWMFVGLFVYALLPIRALQQPVINWGNPVNPENFWWLISGKIYRAYYLQDTLAFQWSRIEASASLLLEQFGLAGIILGFLGLVVFYKSTRLFILTIWIGLIFWITSLIYQSSDSHVYFIPTIISFSIWIGVCVGYGIKYLKRYNPFLQPIILSILIIYIVVGGIRNWKKVDASQDDRAVNFVKDVFTIAPENAILFAEGDQAIFSLWYFHFALEERSDLIVLATDLLNYDWYLESMRKRYTPLELPGSFHWPSTVIAANPSRDICYVEYANRTVIRCQSPGGG